MNRRGLLKTLAAGAAVAALPAITDGDNEYRRVYIGVPRNGCLYWERHEFEELKRGDRFFFDDDLEHELEALSDPVPCEPDGNWSIVTNRMSYDPGANL